MPRDETRTDAELTEDLSQLRRAGRLRMGVLVLLGIALVAGLLGLFDPKDGSSTGAGGGYELDAEYPSSARAGIGSPLKITVLSAGGFDEDEVQLAVTKEWIDLFESPDLQPEPSSATADSDRVIWTFDSPPGELLEISSILTPEPVLSSSEKARISVVDPAGEELVGIDADTRVIP